MSWLMFWTIFNLVIAAINTLAAIGADSQEWAQLHAGLAVLCFGAFILLAGKL